MTKDEKLLFGERLRKIRSEKWFTQEETADRLNISLRYYQMLERGENVGSVDLLISLSDIMDCSLDYLLKGRMNDEGNSFAAKFNDLSPRQRAYAEKMLELWIESINPD